LNAKLCELAQKRGERPEHMLAGIVSRPIESAHFLAFRARDYFDERVPTDEEIAQARQFVIDQIMKKADEYSNALGPEAMIYGLMIIATETAVEVCREADSVDEHQDGCALAGDIFSRVRDILHERRRKARMGSP
jgi:hypothetical protein